MGTVIGTSVRLCQTVQVNVDIGNYVVLGLLCTLFKLIWEAIAGDTSLITPPPPSGFKPGVQTPGGGGVLSPFDGGGGGVRPEKKHRGVRELLLFPKKGGVRELE